MAKKGVGARQKWEKTLKTLFETEDTGTPTLSFRGFVDKVYPKYKWYRHCEVLADILQRVANGEINRLMIFMPPRHGKSQLTTKLFTAYYLYKHPDKWVGISAYAAELAYTFSRASRDAYREAGGKLKGDAQTMKHWESLEGGGVWASGVGGPITGKGFSLGCIDDPLKNHEEAFSDRIRERQKEWYSSTFYTRAESDAAIILIMTRWHEDDLAGWLLSESSQDDSEQWYVLSMPAISEDDGEGFWFELAVPNQAATLAGLHEGDRVQSLGACFPFLGR